MATPYTSQGSTPTSGPFKYNKTQESDTSKKLTSAGMGMSAIGALRKGRSLKQGFDYNAGIARNNASSVLADARIENLRQQKATDSLIGEQMGAIAKSGVQFSGSPMEMIKETAEEGNLAQQFNSYYAERQAADYRAEDRLARRAGKDARMGSYIEAGQAALMAAAKLY